MAAATASPGVIEPGVLYSLAEFQSRTGLKRFALRTARKNGLQVRYTGGRAFVNGTDWIEYVAKQSATPSVYEERGFVTLG